MRTTEHPLYLRHRDKLLDQINEIVQNNILYGQPPYIRHHQPAEEILADILHDLTEMQKRLAPTWKYTGD